MAAMDHVGQQGAVMQGPLTSPMAPPHEYGPQGRGQRPHPLEDPLGKQAEEGEAAVGSGRKHQQEGEVKEMREEEWQEQEEGGEQGGKGGGITFSSEEYWEVMSSNLMALLGDELKKGQQEWQQVCGREQQCLARLQDLHKNAHSMNVSFHSQLDSLHSTVLGLVSSFKK